jgi:uncharacterized protein YdhG (YjbR/CyaY superfamily)
LVYFAAFKKHIRFYPGSKDVRKKFKALSIYEGKEGSLKFPLDRPIPYDLIGRIVKFREEQNLKKPEAKKRR